MLESRWLLSAIVTPADDVSSSRIPWPDHGSTVHRGAWVPVTNGDDGPISAEAHSAPLAVDGIPPVGAAVIEVRPFTRLNPQGGLISASLDNTGQVAAGAEVEFTFFAEAGQTLSTVASPASSAVRISLSLLGGETAQSPDAGAPAVLAPMTILDDVTHTIRVSADGPTTFDLDIFRNATLEAEIGDSAPNEILPLDASYISLPGRDRGRIGLVGTSQAQVIHADAVLWGVQPAMGRIVKIEPSSGFVIDAFDAPEALAAGHTEIGLSIAEDGQSLIYVNADLDPDALYRLDPETGAVISIESATGFVTDGLAYEEPPANAGIGEFVFFSHDGVDVVRQGGFSGAATSAWATGSPTGALGGDGSGRQFGFFTDGAIHEYAPFVDTETWLSTLPAPSSDIEGMAFDGDSLYVSTASGDLHTLNPDTGEILSTVNVATGALFGLGARRVQDVSIPPPPPPPPPVPDNAIYVATRDSGGFGGQIEVYDEDGRFQLLIDDPILDTGVISDVEIGPSGHVFASLDVGGNGIDGGLVEFAADGTFLGFMALPDDIGIASLLYPVGFEILADGSLLVPMPNSALILHLDPSGAVIGQRNVAGSAPTDVAVNENFLIYTDTRSGGQQFVNTAADGFGWISFANTNDSELFDSNTFFTGTIRPGNAPVDPQESADLHLFVTNAGDETLRKFDSAGNLELVVPSIGQPIGLAVASGEVLRNIPFALSVDQMDLKPASRTASADGAVADTAVTSLWSVSDIARNPVPGAFSSTGSSEQIGPLENGAEAYVIDDGTSESAVGLTDGGDVMWLNTFTARPGFDTVSSIALTWGKPGGTGVPAGIATRVLLYDDPNNDGDPSDAVLLAEAHTTVTDPNTDVFTTVPISATPVSGTFFVAALLEGQSAGAFPASLDETVPAASSWIVGHSVTGAFDVNDLIGNDTLPTRVEAIGLPGNWLLRADGDPSGQPIVLVPDVDVYTLDLTGKADSLVDVLLDGIGGADFSGSRLEFIDTDGSTVLASASPDPLGPAGTNYDLALIGQSVPAGGIYTLRFHSTAQGEYALVATIGPDLLLESEPNDALLGPLRTLNVDGAALGMLGTPVPSADLIEDGGFELGPGGGAWNESSTNFGTPVCDPGCGNGNGTGPRGGDHWAWFGGIDAFEEGSVDQDVIFPSSPATLTFYLEIPEASGTGGDALVVSIDGNDVFSVTDLDAATYASYSQVMVDVSAFADGSTRNLRFESTVLGSGITNFFVDDVELVPGALGRTGQSSKMIRRSLVRQEPDLRRPVTNQLIVRYADESSEVEAAQLLSSYGASLVRPLPLINGAIVAWPASDGDLEAAAERLRVDPTIAYAEPDYLVHTTDTFPDDPLFSDLWGLHNTGQTGGTLDADIDAPLVWDTFTGSHSVVIASIDTGVDYTHPDLVTNMWTNPGEIPDDGIDNDGNGYVDDVYGIDTFNDDADPFDDNGHGTHTAGTFGGVGGNGVGVAGVNWDVQIMALKFLGADGSGSLSDAIELIQYMTMMKTRSVDPVNLVVSNNSWGGGGLSQALSDAIGASIDAGILFVAAAGNGGPDGVGDNNDTLPHYPSSYDLDGIISVAATDHRDQLAGFSNYGAASVDLAAPGVSILSTTPGETYSFFDGTSMATPHVAGAAALLMASHPNASLGEVKTAIMHGVDPVPGLSSITSSGGRLNLSSALTLMGLIGPSVTSIDPTGTVNDLNVGRITIRFSEPITASSALNAANFELLAAGPNDILEGGTGDDLFIPVTPSFDGTATVELVIDETFAPLSLGSYQLTIVGSDPTGSVQDLEGNPLNSTNGPGNGSDDVRSFEIVFLIEPGSDLYALDLSADEAVTLSTRTLLDHPGATPLNDLDPVLVVMDPGGMPVATDDNSADGRNAQLSFVAPVDGVYTIQVRAKSGLGEYLLAVEPIAVASDTTPPQVVEVLVSSTAWSPAFLDQLEGAGSGFGQRGYAIPVGDARQFMTLPWINIDQLMLRFNEPVSLAASDLQVHGADVLRYDYSPGAFTTGSGPGGAFQAVWTLQSPMGPEALHLALADSVTDLAGNVLDGEWTNGVSTQSGDGTAGGVFSFDFRVLPGDMDQSDVVGADDLQTILSRFTQSVPIGDFGAGDVAGSGGPDGVVGVDDLQIVLSRFTSMISLPTEDRGALSQVDALDAASRTTASASPIPLSDRRQRVEAWCEWSRPAHDRLDLTRLDALIRQIGNGSVTDPIDVR